MPPPPPPPPAWSPQLLGLAQAWRKLLVLRKAWEPSGMVAAQGNGSSLGAWIKPVGVRGRTEGPRHPPAETSHCHRSPGATSFPRVHTYLISPAPGREAWGFQVWWGGRSRHGRAPSRSQTSSPSLPLCPSPSGSQVLRKVTATPQSPTHSSTPTALPQPLKQAPQALGGMLCQGQPANSK